MKHSNEDNSWGREAGWAVIYQGTDSKAVGGSRGTTGMVQELDGAG